jgi:hypothetical protein
MIHTMCIRALIDRRLYGNIIRAMEFDASMGYPSTTAYSQLGFREINIISEATGIGMRRFLEIVLNPCVLVTGRNTIRSIARNDIDSIQTAFSDAIDIIFEEEVSERLPPFNDWSCHRIDYCADVFTPHVAHYVELFRRTGTPRGYFDNREGSYYISTQSATINFYNKLNQLQNRYGHDLPGYIYEEARNMLRVEIQCYQRELYTIRDHHRASHPEFNITQIHHYLSPIVAEWTLLRFYDAAVGRGDYFTLENGLEIIWRNSDIERYPNIYDIYRLIAASDDLQSARLQFTCPEGAIIDDRVIGGSDRVFRNNLNRLRNMGINPVSIRDDWNIDSLDNVRPLIIEALAR